MKLALGRTNDGTISLAQLLEGVTEHEQADAFVGRQSWLIRAVAVLLAAGFFVLISTLWPASVNATGPLAALEVEASYDLALALEMFGTTRESNYCAIFFGGTSVRPDLAVVLQVRHAESELARDRDVAAVMEEFSAGRLYAWVDIQRSALFLTDHYGALSQMGRYATLFHEVRGHWELRLSDKQMLAVLDPGYQGDNTHLISLAILHGCPSLRGMTTEEAYRIAFEAGPFLD